MDSKGLFNLKPLQKLCKLGAICIVSLALIWPQFAVANESPLVLGVFPRQGFTRTIENFTPLAEYLHAHLGRKVVVRTGRNFAEFWQAVSRGDYDIVHYNQYHYVRSHKELGYQVIAQNEEHHKTRIRGVIIVRKDSGINSIADLRGKKIVFGGGRNAMQSYIVASYVLQQAGLSKDQYQTVFSESPPNAIFATYFHQADAAGTGDNNMDIPVIQNRINMSQLKVLAHSQDLAQLPWAVKPSLSPEIRQHIAKLLTTLNQSLAGREVLKRAGLTAIRPAIDSDYNPDRKIIRAVLGESY